MPNPESLSPELTRLVGWVRKAQIPALPNFGDVEQVVWDETNITDQLLDWRFSEKGLLLECSGDYGFRSFHEPAIKGEILLVTTTGWRITASRGFLTKSRFAEEGFSYEISGFNVSAQIDTGQASYWIAEIFGPIQALGNLILKGGHGRTIWQDATSMVLPGKRTLYLIKSQTGGERWFVLTEAVAGEGPDDAMASLSTAQYVLGTRLMATGLRAVDSSGGVVAFAPERFGRPSHSNALYPPTPPDGQRPWPAILYRSIQGTRNDRASILKALNFYSECKDSAIETQILSLQAGIHTLLGLLDIWPPDARVSNASMQELSKSLNWPPGVLPTRTLLDAWDETFFAGAIPGQVRGAASLYFACQLRTLFSALLYSCVGLHGPIPIYSAGTAYPTSFTETRDAHSAIESAMFIAEIGEETPPPTAMWPLFRTIEPPASPFLEPIHQFAEALRSQTQGLVEGRVQPAFNATEEENAFDLVARIVKRPESQTSLLSFQIKGNVLLTSGISSRVQKIRDKARLERLLSEVAASPDIQRRIERMIMFALSLES